MRKNGFTLVEVLLYLVIISSIVLLFSSILYLVLSSREKNKTISGVENQGYQVLEQISDAIKNAESVTSPIQGNNDSTLTLAYQDVTKNPTVFTLAGGTVTMQEAGGSTIDISSSNYTVTNLSFKNVSYTDTPGSIKVEITVERNTTSERQEYAYSKTFYTSASLR